MDAQEIREQLELGELVLVNGHFAFIEEIGENGIAFLMSSEVDLSNPLIITKLEESKGEHDVRQDDSGQSH